MTYSSLMVYVDDEADNVARIGFARDLAVVFDATLIGISVSEPEPPLVDAYVAGGMAGEILTLRRDQADGELAAAKTRFLDALKDTGIAHEWRAETGYPAACVAHQARAADMILIGRDAGRLPYRAPDAGDLIMKVEQTGANLIVAGAWGHSRMREWVLGGVTQALLNRSQSWLLFSH